MCPWRWEPALIPLIPRQSPAQQHRKDQGQQAVPTRQQANTPFNSLLSSNLVLQREANCDTAAVKTKPRQGPALCRGSAPRSDGRLLRSAARVRKENISYFLKKLFSTGVDPILPNVHVQFPSNEASANYCTFMYFLSIAHPPHNYCHLKSCSRQQISSDFDTSQLGAAKSCSICFLIKTWCFFYSNCPIIAKAISLMSILIRLHSSQSMVRHCSRAGGGHAPSVPMVHPPYFPRAT